jgi:hypothetical protein
VVMVPPRPSRGWGRDGFGAKRGGRGAGHFGRRGLAWHRIDHTGGHEDQERGDPILYRVGQERVDRSTGVDRAIEVEAKKQDLDLGSSSSNQQGIKQVTPNFDLPDKGKAFDVVDSCVVKSNLGNVVEGGPSRDRERLL